MKMEKKKRKLGGAILRPDGLGSKECDNTQGCDVMMREGSIPQEDLTPVTMCTQCRSTYLHKAKVNRCKGSK